MWMIVNSREFLWKTWPLVLKEKSEIGALLATLMTGNFVCELFDFSFGRAYSVS